MAKKLFAMENIEGEGSEVELEAAPEVGEVADAQVDVVEDVADVEGDASGVEEAVGAADQMEEVQDVVEQAVEEGDGLDPVAAEAIRIAVEAICARVGANPKSMFQLYATENFRSQSSRKANTKLALEGIGEFLKQLWEKIKAAVKSLGDKMVAFWNKHVSSLNRSLKALESMKERVSAMKGTPSYENITVPANLQAIFPTNASNLDGKVIGGYADAVATATKLVESQFRGLEKVAAVGSLKDVDSAVAGMIGGKEAVFEFGDEKQPFPGGQYFKWTFKFEDEQDDGVTVRTLEVEEDHGKFADNRKEAQLEIASKDTLKSTLNELITSVKGLIKYRDRVEQRNRAVQNAFKNIDKEIQGLNGDASKEAKMQMRTFNMMMTKAPMIEAKLLAGQLGLVKGVLAYTAVCIKHTTVK